MSMRLTLFFICLAIFCLGEFELSSTAQFVSLHAYLIVARVSVTLFPRFAVFHCRIHRKIPSGQKYDYKQNDAKNQHVHPAA
jgi:hypothetical protein